MELNELYEIIGKAIMIITEIILGYCVIKLVKMFYYEIYNNNSKINKIFEEKDKRAHFKKHFKKWLKDKELQEKYSDFNNYYDIQYNKRFKYLKAYEDFIKHKENRGEIKWQKK